MAQVAMGALALVTVAVVSSIGATGLNPIRLHQAARATPAAVVLLTALAAAGWTWRGRPVWRYTAPAAAVLAVLATGAATTAFLDRAGRDAFLLAAAPFTLTDVKAAPAAEFDVPFQVEMLRLSPHGRRAGVTSEGDGLRTPSHSARKIFYVTGPGGSLTPIDADDIAFVDDDRVLVLAISNTAAELRDVDVVSSSTLWRQALPDLEEGVLAFDRATRRWTVTGSDRADRFVRLTGIVGQPEQQRWAWSFPTSDDGLVQGFATQNGTVVAVETVRNAPLLAIDRRTWLRSLVPALMTPPGRSEVWTLRGNSRDVQARSVLAPTCRDDGLEGGLLVCAVFDGVRTHVLTFDATRGTPAAGGVLDGSLIVLDVQSDGWFSGRLGSVPAAAHLASRALYRLSDAGRSVYAVTGTNRYAATAAWHGDGSRIRIYAVGNRAADGPQTGR
jgi:hypothetical protein